MVPYIKHPLPHRQSYISTYGNKFDYITITVQATNKLSPAINMSPENNDGKQCLNKRPFPFVVNLLLFLPC